MGFRSVKRFWRPICPSQVLTGNASRQGIHLKAEIHDQVPSPPHQPSTRFLTAWLRGSRPRVCRARSGPNGRVDQHNKHQRFDLTGNWLNGIRPGTAEHGMFNQPADYEVWFDGIAVAVVPSVDQFEVTAGTVNFRNTEGSSLLLTIDGSHAGPKQFLRRRRIDHRPDQWPAVQHARCRGRRRGDTEPSE